MRLIQVASTMAQVSWKLIAIACLAAVPLRAFLDHDAIDGPRWAAFPAALVLLDPWTWTGFRHSALVALTVAAGSLLLGIPLALLLHARNDWGRGWLGRIALAPVMVPPLIGAVGFRVALGPNSPTTTLAMDSFLWRPWTWGIGAAWSCWIWVGLSFGVPLVARSVLGVLERLDPLWIDAGRAAGATHRQAWFTIVWPIIRPAACRSAALVFGWTLADAGAPLVLGLRSTLGYQIVEDTLGMGVSVRAAVLVLMTFLTIVAVFLLVRLGAAPDEFTIMTQPRRASRQTGRMQRLGISLLLVFGIALIWLPFGLLAAANLRGHAGVSSAVGAIRSSLQNEGATPAWIHSFVLGTTVATLAYALTWLTSWKDELGGRVVSNPRTELTRPTSMSSLILGVGFLCAASVAVTLAQERFPVWSGDPSVEPMLERVIRGLDPAIASWVILTTILVIVHHSPLQAGHALARRNRDVRSEAMATTCGAGPFRAWWDMSRRRVLPDRLSAWLLVAVLAGTDTGAALVLSRSMDCRPVGPRIIDLIDQPGGLASAQALALMVLIGNGLAYGVAGYRREFEARTPDAQSRLALR